MRTKEEAHDYRYFPDPDLLPLDLTPDYLEQLRSSIPELPDAKKTRFVSEYGLSIDDAGVLVAEKEVAEYFEQVTDGHDPKIAANWVIHELFGALNRLDRKISGSPVSAEKLGKLIGLISDETISGRIAKDVFEEMVETGADPAEVVKKRGLEQITDSGAIEEAVGQVIANNPKQAQEVRAGNDKAIGWFVGQVMKVTQGKANPQMVNQLLRNKLG